MSRLVGRKIILILAIWFLSGGLAFADSFDLTDELQHSLLDKIQCLEADLDEVRDSVATSLSSLTPFYPLLSPVRSPRLLPLFNLPPEAAGRPLHEVLRTFRI